MHYWASYVNGRPTHCFELDRPADRALIHRGGLAPALSEWLVQAGFPAEDLIVAVVPTHPVLATTNDALAQALKRRFEGA